MVRCRCPGGLDCKNGVAHAPFVLGVKGANGSGNGCTGIGVSQQIPFVELQKQPQRSHNSPNIYTHIYKYIKCKTQRDESQRDESQSPDVRPHKPCPCTSPSPARHRPVAGPSPARRGSDQRIGSIDRGRKSMHGSDPWIRSMYPTHRSASGRSTTRSLKVSHDLTRSTTRSAQI